LFRISSFGFVSDFVLRISDLISSPYNRPLHLIALLTAAATFPLIFMGGLVTSHGAGMSVPDWPNSYGYNMFTFPPSKWIGGIVYEHTHRLMGTVVGMFSIALTVVAWRVEPRRWVRWLAAGTLGMVILQGILGGLRVVLVKLDLAIVHACLAQAFFCLASLVVIVTSRWWLGARDLSSGATGIAGRRLVGLAAACLFAVYAQLIVGATMRHYGAGLAIPDLPLAYGKLLPPSSTSALDAVNDYRVWQLNEKPVTLAQVWLHFGHRVGAVIVSILTAALVVSVLRRHRSDKALRNPAILLAGLLLAQLTLGVLTVLLKKPADISSAHVAVGALVLVTTFTLLVRAARSSVSRGRLAHAHEDKHAWARRPRHELPIST
jgi:cytochrome c oxidase assembly protein subunit 15